MTSRDDKPLVSVVIPCLNEQGFIDKMLDSVLNCDYPKEKLEILVVDGMSTDGTRETLKGISAEQTCVKMLDNPAGIVPVAMNIGIRAARGEYIIRLDCHN